MTPNIKSAFTASVIILLSGLSLTAIAQKMMKAGNTFRDCSECPFFSGESRPEYSSIKDINWQLAGLAAMKEIS